jgi:Uma2 family endonuclease
MAETRLKEMTADEFLLWNLDQEERYELVNGVPIPLRAMTGASNAHDMVVVNIILALGNRLRGKPCRVATADTALRISICGVRRPDVTVDCAPADPKSYESRQPLVVVEVLSPSTRKIDRYTKLDEFRRHPTLRHILLVDPDRVGVKHYHRVEGGEWQDEIVEDAAAQLALAAIGVSLPVAEIYEGMALAA